MLTRDLARDAQHGTQSDIGTGTEDGQTHPYVPKGWVRSYVSKEKGLKNLDNLHDCLMFLRIYLELKYVSSKSFPAQSQISFFIIATETALPT